MKNVLERITASCIASNKQILDGQRDSPGRSLSQAEPSAPSSMRLTTAEDDKKVATDAERHTPLELTDEVDEQFVLGYN